MTKQQPTYQNLSAQLNDVVQRIQQTDVQVDEVVKLYGQGLELIAALEKHLKQAENTVEKLQATASK